MNKQQKNKKKGFTLVELVVVIAIIGVLAAVITPRVRLALYKANDAKAVTTLSALRTASNLYYAERNATVGTVGSPSNMTNVQVHQLTKQGYLDAKSYKAITGETYAESSSGDSADVVIIPGTASTATGCNDVSNPTSGTPTTLLAGSADNGLNIVIATDGIELSFAPDQDDNIVDTSCRLWSEK